MIDLKKFEQEIELESNTNQAFLSVSLNMEIVCSALTGINQILREINFDSKNSSFLTKECFNYKKRVRLKMIKVLSPEYFSKLKMQEMIKFQESNESDRPSRARRNNGECIESVGSVIELDFKAKKIEEENVDVDINILHFFIIIKVFGHKECQKLASDIFSGFSN